MAALIEYPCFASGEPRHLNALAVRTIADTLRRRLFGAAARPIDVTELVRRAANLRVNGRRVELAWDIDHAVHDEAGDPVLGVCEHDPDEPDMVMISLNGDLLSDQPHLLRSTAAHELGHAIFDMPAALGSGTRRSFRSQAADRKRGAPAIDWREWRADEFMGAFLVPPGHLARALARQASLDDVPVHWASDGGIAKPRIVAAEAGWDAIEAIEIGLAEQFGVSPAFMSVRLRKHGFVALH
jgi:hypothetical protein